MSSTADLEPFRAECQGERPRAEVPRDGWIPFATRRGDRHSRAADPDADGGKNREEDSIEDSGEDPGEDSEVETYVAELTWRLETATQERDALAKELSQEAQRVVDAQRSETD